MLQPGCRFRHSWGVSRSSPQHRPRLPFSFPNDFRIRLPLPGSRYSLEMRGAWAPPSGQCLDFKGSACPLTQLFFWVTISRGG